MFSVLATGCSFKEITSAGIELYNNEKLSNVKRKYYLGEEIMMLIIILLLFLPPYVGLHILQ